MEGTTTRPRKAGLIQWALVLMTASVLSAAHAATTVTNVTSGKTDGSYGIGAVIDVEVTFSGAVDVTGIPALQLNISSNGNAYATYASGTGGSTLTFNYTVGAGQTSADLDSFSTS